MARKAGAPKKEKAKPKPKLTDKEQSERFIETARELGVDESGEKFKHALERIVPLRERPKRL
jgi:hypothetical protein